MSFEHSDRDEENAFKGMGEAIESLRSSQGLSTNDLALKADLSERELLKIETGETAATWGALRKIAYSLELTLPELIKKGETKGAGW